MPSSVLKCTEIRWLHCLGFERVYFKKGINIDGHKRQDVVEYRKIKLNKHLVWAHMHHHSDDPPQQPSDKKVVLIFHDERITLIFHSNNNQGWMWGEKKLL